MKNSANVLVVVEGQTEHTFIRDVLAPELGERHIFMSAAVLGAHGHKGGNVNFSRALKDVTKFLKQQQDTYVSTFFDYYGIHSSWPGLTEANSKATVAEKAEAIETATKDALQEKIQDIDVNNRFIPYFAMHEFEAMLFSSPEILAEELDVDFATIDAILQECSEPENINSSPTSAPSKRIIALKGKSYRKILMGKTITERIGIDKIRERCPHFDSWLEHIEALTL